MNARGVYIYQIAFTYSANAVLTCIPLPSGLALENDIISNTGLCINVAKTYENRTF